MAAGDAVLKPEGNVFYSGVVVGAYKQSVVGTFPSGPKPDATAAATATIAAAGTATFSGLTAEKHYLAPKPVNEVQTLTVDATSGNFRLRANGVDTTPDLKYNITAANLKTELEALPSIGSGQIASVTGGPGDSGGTTPYVITFGGTLAATNVPILEVLSGLAGNASTALANLAGGGAAATVAATTQGRPGGDEWIGFYPDTA